jgi:hypothetical protein
MERDTGVWVVRVGGGNLGLNCAADEIAVRSGSSKNK